METIVEYKEVVKATEEGIRNTSSKEYYFPDDFNYKVKKEFFLALALSTKNAKEISIIYWLLSNMLKNNIVYNINSTALYTKAAISKPVYYKLISRLVANNLIIKIDTKTIMVNPELVINHRKSLNKDRPQLLALWYEYKKQQRKILWIPH